MPAWDASKERRPSFPDRRFGHGADGRVRTYDPLLTRQTLYQLSYAQQCQRRAINPSGPDKPGS
jgi:hypothetical protein